MSERYKVSEKIMVSRPDFRMSLASLTDYPPNRTENILLGDGHDHFEVLLHTPKSKFYFMSINKE